VNPILKLTERTRFVNRVNPNRLEYWKLEADSLWRTGYRSQNAPLSRVNPLYPTISHISHHTSPYPTISKTGHPKRYTPGESSFSQTDLLSPAGGDGARDSGEPNTQIDETRRLRFVNLRIEYSRSNHFSAQGTFHRRFISKGDMRAHTHRDLIREWRWESKGSSLEYS